MRTIVSFLPALACVGAMVGCARMATVRTPNQTASASTAPRESEMEALDG